MKKIYTHEGLKLVENINFYLKPAPNFFIEARKTPICDDAPEITTGSMPADNGNLILTIEERDELLKREQKAKKFIKSFVGAEDFIQRKTRYCLWLVNAKPDDIKKCPLVMKRIEAVKEFRLASKRNATKRLADSPSLFAEIRQPTGNYIIVPRHSSENREYVPLGFMSSDTIPSNAISIIPNATLYHFVVLTSRVHLAWMRATAGRLKSDYRYSNTVVYNNFVWPLPSEKQKSKIEATAQKILDVRAKFPESSFASLYNPLTMPPELLKAHKANAAAVCEAYESEADCRFSKDISEEEIVNALMNRRVGCQPV